MAYQEYAIAVGLNNAAGLKNIEDFIYNAIGGPRRFVLKAEPVPPGSVTLITGDQKAHYDGTPVVEWRYSIIPVSGLSAIVTAFMTSIATDNASVTIRTRGPLQTFANYSAETELVRDYQIQRGADGVQYARNVTFRHRIVAAL
jgi:hypothetical protein